MISIHALAKRATYIEERHYDEYGISIHALAKRATYKQTIFLIFLIYFNPRPRKEGDKSLVLFL